MRSKSALDRTLRGLPVALLGAGLVAAPLPASANAMMSGAVLPLAVRTVADSYCASRAARAPAGAVSGASKAAAILGGAPSRLEQMRLQQQGQDASLVAVPADASEGIAAVRPLRPALGARASFGPCGNGGIRPAVHLAGVSEPGSSPDDFLASKRVRIGRTMFDGQWSRVRHARLSRAQLATALDGLGHGDQIDLIAQVNRWTNRNIRYVEDRDLWGKPDLWAGAGTTLRLRKGDCEDIAITKMQLLAAAGVARKDMILTVARDLVRNADHAVLIVRHQGRYLLLDNSTDRVLDARYSHDYRPVLSFSEGQTWLHGY